MVNRKTVAQKAGVSTATVSNVMNYPDKVKPVLRKRVLQIVNSLNYSPNQVARSLKTKNSRHIGIIANELTNLYYMEIITAIQNAALDFGYIATIFTLAEGREEEQVKQVLGRRIDGLLNLSSYMFSRKNMESFLRHDIKLGNFPCPQSEQFRYDYTTAMNEAMKLAAALGHKKVGFIFGYDRPRAHDDFRTQAYFEGVKRHGFAAGDKYVIFDELEYSCSEEIGHSGAKELLRRDNEITMLICINDMTAIGALAALAELGLGVPRDVSVMGCDNINLGRFVHPRLSTIDVNYKGAGQYYVRNMINMIEGREIEKEALKTVFVNRESIGKVKNKG